MEIDDVLTLIGLSAAGLAFFTYSFMPGLEILFIFIGAISISSGIVIRSRRTLRELKSFMKGDNESNKDQEDN